MSLYLNRRDFIKLGSRLAVIMGLGSQAIPGIAEALENLANGRVDVIWMQAQSCSGCTISMIDSEAPGPAEVLTRYISLLFHHTLSATQGESCMEIIEKTTTKGGHILVVEGSIPAGMPEACMVGHHSVNDIVLDLAKSASHVIAIGACAAFGGIPAAKNSPAGSLSVSNYLQKKGVQTPTVNVPGCPIHPDWFVGTLVHLVKFGVPKLDSMNRPTMFFGETNHNRCPRFYDYERGNFAKKFSDPGCLFELGCLGVVTHADCTIRDRNGGMNNCIKAGAPCVGCSSEFFALDPDVPFYRKIEQSTKES
jgi:hydrogenase small subunit